MNHQYKDKAFPALGGAVLGAVAMYLLDPDAGNRRRRHLADSASAAAHGAGEHISPLLTRVGEGVHSLGESMASGASSVADSASEWSDSRPLHRLGETAGGWTQALRDRLNYGAQRASHYAHHPSHLFRREEPSHAGQYSAIAAAGVGTLLLGAGAMYFLDPARGRARRNQATEQATSLVKRTGRSFSRYGRDLRNRMTGVAHQAQSMAGGGEVAAEQLLQRVRAAMGHVVSRADLIQVMTDDGGRVTLHGRVLASEVDSLLSAVRRIHGVSEITNLLSVKETEQGLTEEGAELASGQYVPRL